jgi:hypothetical protein
MFDLMDMVRTWVGFSYAQLQQYYLPIKLSFENVD